MTVDLKRFITELGEYTQAAEKALNALDENAPHAEVYREFSEQMIAIRGTALQLGQDTVATIAGLGEEIACKGGQLTSPSMHRRAVGALWDAVSTVKYLLENPGEGVSEEGQILMGRLEGVLRVFGGARPTMGTDEIEKLLRERKS